MDTQIEHDSTAGSSRKANHICVLVHGLWGNSNHLKYVTDSLRAKYSEDQLVIHACKKNASAFTYDGIEIGGERVAREIEETIDELERAGHTISRFSIVGYSLGGLIARYAIGLLEHQGFFKQVTPVSFTTFASPHLGIRTPRIGYANHLWNVLGARTLAASGRQLFAIDNFRGTGRPLLSVLADPDSIFIHALAKFERRVLYANVINDRSAVYYTTGISKTDPYAKIDELKLNYVKGYEPVILDPNVPCEPRRTESSPSFYERFTSSNTSILNRAPIYLALTLLLPIGVVAFLVNSSIQTFRSQRRILLHENDSEAKGWGMYRIPYTIRKVQVGLEDVYENANASQEQDYLPAGSEEVVDTLGSRRSSSQSISVSASTDRIFSEKARSEGPEFTADRTQPPSQFPTLALTNAQFDMIEALDHVGFRKYPVHIHLTGHSHAAIIVRIPSRASQADGKVVIQHWLDQEFIL